MAKCFCICFVSCCALSVPRHDPASRVLPPASVAPNSHQYHPQLNSSKQLQFTQHLNWQYNFQFLFNLTTLVHSNSYEIVGLSVSVRLSWVKKGFTSHSTHFRSLWRWWGDWHQPGL